MTLHTFRMPDLGEGIAEVELVKWRVHPGDLIAEDQILCDVLTDKAAVEIPSSVAGRVVELGGEVGQMMAVGSTLIRVDGETAPTAATPATVAGRRSPPQTAAGPESRPRALPSARVLASPAVRARARTFDVPLDQLQGSGPDGRVLHADLDAARPIGARQVLATDATREVKLIGLRRKIAQKMLESKRHIPHYTYVEEVDVTEMLALRAVLNREHGAVRGELSPLAFIVRAVVRAVAYSPQVNARFDDAAGVLTLHDAVHLGVATQTEAGLLVPVLRQAQTLDLWACATAIARLAAGARAGKALREELSGSTITVTSLGKLGGVVSTPVINHPEVAIVGVNRIVARPAVRDGAIQVRQMMNLSSSFDHRVVDGAVAAAYIQRVRQLLEHPTTLFID